MNQITNNSIKYTLLASYARTKLTRGWVATIYYDDIVDDLHLITYSRCVS